ncbi:HD-GYP domain-containing protein [Butyrivibrio sp. AE3004]|uniref:HD-GYP domain-containing protein n=1 Tax=Butyrivibrio sp. AE3004 TaxID=1506994 RepID=UPI000493C378|nr:HD-GYP domain-containing protein [Butyrivibrio sp. AE3004]
MFELLRACQLDIMLVLAGICGVTAAYTILAKNMTPRRKACIAYLQLSGMILMIADRLAYIYRGDESTLGFWMVRITNFLVYFMSFAILHAFNLYLSDVLREKDCLGFVPFSLRIVEIIISVGELFLVVSQFTGWLYTFDETNHYHRASGLMFFYLFPFATMIIFLCTIIKYHGNLRRRLRIGFLFFATAPIIATAAQIFLYGLSLTNITIVVISIMIYTFSLIDLNDMAELAYKKEVDYLRKERKSIKNLFDQTAMALVSAIDAKDKYTHGHSSRVAEYARRIAVEYGMNDKECDEVYYAALLHDVGKIGVSDEIIEKASGLTDEEYEEIQQHVYIGSEILSSITEFPYLSIGAKYHHERYDGKGYPDKLRGDDIPVIARIIAVADAYDVMTSKRKYRDASPQEKVREEIIKGTGTQFDPVFAKIMLHLIDIDEEYEMQEKTNLKELAGRNELHPVEYRSEVSEGILINQYTTKIHMKCETEEDLGNQFSMPALLLFDSLDGRIYNEAKKIEELNYFEFGEIWFDGNKVCSGARDIQTQIKVLEKQGPVIEKKSVTEYDVEAVKIKDHAKITISSKYKIVEAIIALPNASRFMYISLTGEHCHITDVVISKADEPIDENYIPRIAEEISYINTIVGDVPNIQVDGYHMAITDGVPIRDGMRIDFHAMSLPTARLVWHCPHIIFFYSDDKKVNGPNYKEFALIRLDGEYWESNGSSENKMVTNILDDFENWDVWKEFNKKGYDCELKFTRFGNRITLTTVNGGISIRNVTNVYDNPEEIYVALTGDQVALTEIRYL